MKRSGSKVLLSFIFTMILLANSKTVTLASVINATETTPMTENFTIATPTETQVTTQTTEPVESAPIGMYRSELTNEWISETLRNQRPIAAMVDNEKASLPHYGTSQADVVYEMMNSTANGRITRLMVLIKDWQQISRLGNIRSLRPTNILLAAEWNAVLCHDGGPFYNNAYLNKGYMNNFSGGFARIDNGKSKVYTEYITTGELAGRFQRYNVTTQYNEFYPGTHFKFADELNPIYLTGEGTSSCSKIELPFYHNKSNLVYNVLTQTYDYYEYGKAHVDAGNHNKQTSFKNVIIQDCTYHVYDKNGYMIFNCIDIFRSGYYITNGRVTPILWMKTSDTDITRYFGLDGQEITINTGKTYIALCPDDDFPKIKIYP